MADDIEDTETTIDELFDSETVGSENEEAETDTGETTATDESQATEDDPDEEELATPANEKDAAFKTAYLDEKRKRQELEQRLAEREPEKLPDPVEDPEGYAAALDQRRETSELRLKVSLSRDLLIDSKGKDDYESKEAVFVELTKQNPSLVSQMHASANPARFAYETAVEHLEVKQLRDPEYIAKLVEEKARALLAEMTAPTGKAKRSALDVPSVTKVTAAGNNTVDAKVPSDLSEIMADSAL